MNKFANMAWVQRMKQSKWFHRVYAYDWAFAFVLFVVIQLLMMFIEPFHRYLPENDPSVNYPSTPDIVPDWALAIISPGIPIIAIIAVNLSGKRGSHDLHHALLAFAISLMMTNNITTVLKMAGGRYRPDWRNDETPDRQGRFAFPSGHASNSFAGMSFICLYLFGKFKVFGSKRTHCYAKICLMTSPMLIAFFVAISRTMDYHHNFSDVTAGAILGAGCTVYSYFLYFPSLWSKSCDKPKPYYTEDEIATFPAVNLKEQESTHGDAANVAFVVV
jgi:membrane-associated phospholipid phosphatase